MKKRLTAFLLSLVLFFGLFSRSASAASGDYKGSSSWALAELDKAAANGLITDRVKGDVSADVTREEFAEIVVKLYEKVTGKRAAAGNAKFGDTVNPEILKAANLGLVTGVGAGRYDPAGRITREQMALILFRALKVMNPDADFSTSGAGRFADDQALSSWAREGVYYCAKNSIIAGVGGNKFAPRGNSTRQVALIVCVRAYEAYGPAAADAFRENADNAGTGTDSINTGGGNTGVRADSVNSGGTGTDDTDSAQAGRITGDELLLINDMRFIKGEYTVKAGGENTFIFIPLDKFRYAFKRPYTGNNLNPIVQNRDGNIQMKWENAEDEAYLTVVLQAGNPLAVINGSDVDIIEAPYENGEDIMIPVNVLWSCLKWKRISFKVSCVCKTSRIFRPIFWREHGAVPRQMCFPAIRISCRALCRCLLSPPTGDLIKTAPIAWRW